MVLCCLFTIISFSQNKTTNSQTKKTATVKKKIIPKKVEETKKCSTCYSSNGKCYMCGGRGWKFCVEHQQPYKELDEDCVEDSFGEKDGCYETVYCRNCGNEDNKSTCGICVGSGTCKVCDGTGKIKND